jgi:hypothetical protein
VALPRDIALLSEASLAALRGLLGFSLRGWVVDPSLTLQPRGQFTTEGRYDVTWSSFVIEPAKSRYSDLELPSPSVWCRTVQSEIDGVLVTSLEAVALTPDVMTTSPLPNRIAHHATGALALFPLRRIEIWGRDTGFPFADEYNNAAPIPADRRVRFVGVSPSDNEGGFSLVIPNSGSGLYFMREHETDLVSVPEEQYAHAHLTLRMSILHTNHITLSRERTSYT